MTPKQFPRILTNSGGNVRIKNAERGGFEPPVRFDPHTAFPVPHNRPLCHLSGNAPHPGTAARVPGACAILPGPTLLTMRFRRSRHSPGRSPFLECKPCEGKGEERGIGIQAAHV